MPPTTSRTTTELLDEVDKIDTYSSEERAGLAVDLAALVRRLQAERDTYATRAQIAEASLMSRGKT